MECHFPFRICERGHTWGWGCFRRATQPYKPAQRSVIVTHLDRHVLLPHNFSPVLLLLLPFPLAALLGHPGVGVGLRFWPRQPLVRLGLVNVSRARGARPADNRGFIMPTEISLHTKSGPRDEEDVYLIYPPTLDDIHHTRPIFLYKPAIVTKRGGTARARTLQGRPLGLSGLSSHSHALRRPAWCRPLRQEPAS